MRGNPFAVIGGLLFLSSALSMAAPVQVTSMSRSGNQILSLTVNGAAIGQNRFQTGTLTGFAGQTSSVVLAPDDVSLANGAAAQGYLSDFLFDSGLINPAIGANAITLTFSPALVNRPGPDVIVLEINGSSPADAFQVRINGTTNQVSGSQFGSTGFSTSSSDVLVTKNAANTAEVTVTSLSQFQAAPLSLSSSNNISQVVYGVALDLSDFGVADGASVTTVEMGSSATGSNFDPVFVAGIVPATEITSGVIISEFLTDNGEGIEDEDGSKPDWLELYNGTESPVDLSGWALTNNAGQPKRWLIPNGTVIQPFEYKLVFCSSKNRTGLVLHTSFNLGKNSGYVALVRPDSSVASSYTYGAQAEDVSYGVKGVALTPGFLATPTPGSANLGTQMPNGPAADVVFSAASGVFGANFDLTLSLPAGASGTIRYTTDLSEPTESSPAYSTSIPIVNSTTVRARVFRADYLPGFIGNRHYVRIGSNVTANYRGTGQPFKSNLPVLVLDSFGADVDANTSQSAPYRTTVAAIYEPDSSSGQTSLGNAPTVVRRGGTHVRGQSSATFPQRQYALEFWKDHIDEDEKYPFLGLPEGADWVLHAPWNDKTLIRNAFAFGLARDWAGPGAGMRTRFVEVFFNQTGTTLDWNDYRGVYVLVEKIKRDEERVNVEELTPLSTDITGGYIFAKDKPPYDNAFTTSTTSAWGGQPMDLQEPGTPTGAQLDYMRTYMNGFEAALSGTSYADPVTGYAAYIDATSFQDWHLMAEFARQTDAFQNSNYFHKKRGQKVKALPVWDFNMSFANNAELPTGGSAQPGQGPSEGWHWIRLFDDWLNQKGPSHYPWFPRLFQDPEFKRGYWDRYWQKRRTVLSDAAVAQRVDALAAQVNAGFSTPVTNGTGTWPNSTPSVESPAGRHFARWQILGSYVWTTPIGWADRTTHAHEVSMLKNWLQGRLEWMDTQSMSTTPTSSVESVASAVSFPPEMIYAGGTTFGLVNENAESGMVLYTIDGSDPRDVGGGINAGAITAGAGQVTSSDLVSFGSLWKFTAPGSAPPGWQTEGFDDASWTSVSNMREQAQTSTVYFRKRFNFSRSGTTRSIRFDMLADDGAVVWLNGVELRRVGMPFTPTAIGHATSATAIADKGREAEWRTWICPPGVLREGNNTIAIEVHQYTHVNGVTLASDLSFDLRIRELFLVPGYPLLSVSPEVQVIKARVKNGSEWSPLTETSITAAVNVATSANLAVTELMYHPDGRAPYEGVYTANDFEFIELTNISANTIDMGGVTLADAVTFDFDSAPPAARILAPGARVLVVANPSAFGARYPGSTAVIAGTFSGDFSNSGEQVSVLDRTGAVIRRFTYTDDEPWPVDAGGGNVSMVLNAAADLDHTVPFNWHAGATVRGTPGMPDHVAAPADPNGDSNGNGLTNFHEFALGGATPPTFVMEPMAEQSGAVHAIFRFRRNLAAGGLVFEPQACDDLATWDPAKLVYVKTQRQEDGTAVVTYRSALPANQLPGKFFARLKVR